MEWIEKHSVFIMLVLACLGWFAQVVTARHQLKDFMRWKDEDFAKWRGEINIKLASIDNEISQIKISDAREIMRTNALYEDVAHTRRRLDDFHETFIMALSSGTISFNKNLHTKE